MSLDGRRALRRGLGRALVPATGTGRLLAGVAGVDALGTGLFLTSAALYFTRVVGLSSRQVGVGLTLAGLVGLVGAVPIGRVADRLGSGRVFIAMQVLRGFGFLAYCLVGSFGPYVAIACALGLFETVTPPLTVAIVGAAVPPEHRVDTMAKLRAVRNVGFGVGALVASVVIQLGSRPAFVGIILIDAATFFFTGFALHRIGIARLAPSVGGPRRARPAVPNLRYLTAAALNGLLAIHMTLLTLGLPLWIAQRTTAPVGLIGVCVALNAALAALLQARLAGSAQHLAGATRAMAYAGGALAGFCGLVLLAAHVTSAWLAGSLVVAAALPLTFGELWQSAGEWKVSYDLADPAHRAEHLATFQLGTATQQILGPLIVTALILPHPGAWLALGAVVVAAGLAFRPLIAGAPVPAMGGPTQP